MSIFTERFKEVMEQEGVVSIVTWAGDNVNVSNTWNSYLRAPKDGVLFIPAAGMVNTEKNIKENKNVKMTLGSKTVQGLWGPGTGFLVEGTARFIYEGEDYEMMKEAFPFMSRVLAIDVASIKQTV